MKVAVIFTGGTIGSRKQDDGWISPNTEQPYKLIDLYQTKYPLKSKDIEFVCDMPYQILSENVRAENLMCLIERIQACIRNGDYDGILICHGTDTLQYTAAILGYVFADSALPILLVSSNYPLEDVRANGLDNFYYAVETVKTGLTGVLVVYRNSDGNTYVHCGTKLLAHQTFEDDLFSVHQEAIGFYDSAGSWNLEADTRREEIKVPYHGLIETRSSILWLRAYPGMAYPNLTKKTKAVLIESYHSGTIAIDSDMKEFAETAKRLAIPIYLTGAIDDGSGYETIREYQALGIRVLKNQAPIAVYCRLWLENS